MFLSDLPLGQRAIVLQTPDSLPVKLFEMGCMPGEEIELVFSAP
ncbi:MAG: ferrous iron transport protein A, partial [Flavobacteriia bacterium]|nr:ferrous iron transport protein A [Flavobacteriia bacterium]